VIVFRLFSLLFAYPAPEVVKSIEELLQHESLAKLESAKLLDTVDLADLQTEYVRLFVNSYPTLLCPPYESFYREGTVYGNTVNQVRELFKQSGLAYVYEGEPPDHISAELDFLAETGDQSFTNRMCQWVPEFTARVKKNSAEYKVFARELEDLLHARCQVAK
jgi:nitrate reductase assembly molybdenum cofactor insertion protein NarJ